VHTRKNGIERVIFGSGASFLVSVCEYGEKVLYVLRGGEFYYFNFLEEEIRMLDCCLARF